MARSLEDLIDQHPEVEYWEESDQEALLLLDRALCASVNKGSLTDSEADHVEQRFVSRTEHYHQTV